MHFTALLFQSVEETLAESCSRFQDLENETRAAFTPIKEALCNPGALGDLFIWIEGQANRAPLGTQLLATWAYIICCHKNAPGLTHETERLLHVVHLADMRMQESRSHHDGMAIDEAYTSLQNCLVDGTICEDKILQQANIYRKTDFMPRDVTLPEVFITPVFSQLMAILAQGVEDISSLRNFVMRLPTSAFHERMLRSLLSNQLFSVQEKHVMLYDYIQRLNRAPFIDTRQLHDLLRILNGVLGNNRSCFRELPSQFRNACLELLNKPRIFMPRGQVLETTDGDWRLLEPIFISEMKVYKQNLIEIYARLNEPRSAALVHRELFLTLTDYLETLYKEMPARRNNLLEINYSHVAALKNSCLVTAFWLYQGVSSDSAGQIKNTMLSKLRQFLGIKLFLPGETATKEELILVEGNDCLFLYEAGHICRSCYI